ncbi:unnamed protein product [Rotaria sp. Silwood1]|nr:unnamed protein product [Rotaria sp. Silwood1]
MMETIMNIVKRIKQTISQMNLFEVEMARSEELDLRKAIISTRIFIILLTFTLTILTVYSALDGQNQTIIVLNPTQSDFENLYRKYPNTLACPCTDIAIPYRSFISIIPEYHPVCSSIFVSDNWINILFNPNISYYYPLDFRSSASGQFQILSSFCSLSKRFVNDTIDDFLSNVFLTPVVLSSYLLDLQSQAQSSFIQTLTSNAFRQLLQLVRSTTFTNQLQTALRTSSYLGFYIFPNGKTATYAIQNFYSSNNNTICYCGLQSTCSSSVCGFFDLFAYDTKGDYTSSMSLIVNVPGFVAGCYAIESLLQSTLECFFDSTCINTVLRFLSNNNMTDIKQLDVNQTQFSPRTTIDTLFTNLFIEKWSTISSFTEYYKKCSPILCTYTFIQRNSALYIITKLLSLYGGLVIVLRFCVPYIIIWWYNRKNNQTRNNTQIRLIERRRMLWRLVIDKIRKLNLFNTNITRNDPFELRTSIISTRIYIILVCVSVCILIIYVSTNTRTQTFTILNPSQNTFEDLYMKYSSIVKCPCKTIAIQYDNFVSEYSQYHPVCSSLFISAAWLASTSYLNWPDQAERIVDFKGSGQTFFVALQTLCSLAKTTVFNAWYNFKQSAYITDQVVSKKEMIEHIQTTLNQFHSNTVAQFKQSLTLIQFHSINMYAVGAGNVRLETYTSANSTNQYLAFYYKQVYWDNCSCTLNDNCVSPMGFYNYSQKDLAYPSSLIFNIPQFFIGCFVLQSVLQSSLECFFNQTCLDAVQFQIRSSQSINITILQANTTRFLPETLIKVIVDNLMLEQWGDNIQYSQYYQQCAPESCSYTITSHNDFSYIITLLISLFGGVSMALKLAIPIIVRWIRNLYRPNINPIVPSPRIFQRLCLVWNKFKMKIINLNIFESELSYNNDHRRRKEIIKTRIYILLLTINITILIIYNSFSIQTQYTTISHPSQETFNNLLMNLQYSPTLECQCQNITIPYNSFISISPYYHQLCSSDFINMNSGWINMLYLYGIDEEHPYDDFQLFALPQFRTLSSLCNLANQTLTDSLTSFASEVLINKQVQSREAIESQAETIITQFRLSTCRTFVRMLDFIREMAQGNGIVSTIQSNWYFHSINRIQFSSVWATPRSYGDENNCSCGTNSMCTSLALINGSLIPGFRIGCYVLDSLLQSTLECLYNVSCIDQIKYLYNVTNIVIRSLNQSFSFPNETVQSLVDNLLIDKLESNVSYEQYYAVCSPLSCTYSINKRVNPIYIITVIIGLYGGLTVALKLVTSLLMEIQYYFMIIIRRRRIEPVVHIIPEN